MGIKNVAFVRMLGRAALILLTLSAATRPAMAGEMIVNGDFEAGWGEFYGWTKSVQPGSGGDVFVVYNDGGLPPLSSVIPFAYNPDGGALFAITDQTGPGSYALTQSFVANGNDRIKVAFQMFSNSRAEHDASTPPNRDYTVGPNQNVVVDILTGGANAFTTNSTDIVATLYGPATQGIGVHPWISYAFDLGVLAAGTYQFRFAETDNLDFLNAGIDNVSVVNVSTSIPEPATLTLIGLGLGGIGFLRRQAR